jgi:hypothetical protein
MRYNLQLTATKTMICVLLTFVFVPTFPLETTAIRDTRRWSVTFRFHRTFMGRIQTEYFEIGEEFSEFLVWNECPMPYACSVFLLAYFHIYIGFLDPYVCFIVERRTGLPNFAEMQRIQALRGEDYQHTSTLHRLREHSTIPLNPCDYGVKSSTSRSTRPSRPPAGQLFVLVITDWNSAVLFHYYAPFGKCLPVSGIQIQQRQFQRPSSNKL